MCVVEFNLFFVAEREGEIVRERFVVQEVILDHRALVAQAQHEFLEAVRGINLHNMPENRASADLNHWLGTIFRLFP